jgi:hypothetical protein
MCKSPQLNLVLYLRESEGAYLQLWAQKEYFKLHQNIFRIIISRTRTEEPACNLVLRQNWDHLQIFDVGLDGGQLGVQTEVFILDEVLFLVSGQNDLK